MVLTVLSCCLCELQQALTEELTGLTGAGIMLLHDFTINIFSGEGIMDRTGNHRVARSIDLIPNGDSLIVLQCLKVRIISVVRYIMKLDYKMDHI